MTTLYKYLDTPGALATLKNQTLKWTKPSEFVAKYKDNLDMTLPGVFPQDIASVAMVIKEKFVNIARKNTSPILSTISGLQFVAALLHSNAPVAQLVQRDLEDIETAELINIDKINSIAREIYVEINNALQRCRVLCMSSDVRSRRMWVDYSDDEKGIALRIIPSPIKNKDSIFKLFKPVKYYPTRPYLFDNPLDFLHRSLYHDQQSFIVETIDKIIYSKTSDYSYESEYRCVDVLGQEENHQGNLFLPFYQEEVAELYLGRNCEQNNRELYVHLAKKINPHITIFQMTLDFNGILHAAPYLEDG